MQIYTKEPKHDWASHPGDGYSYGCQIMQPYVKPAKGKETREDRWSKAFARAGGGDASKWKTA
jgi:hypothetical protein